MAFTRDFQAGLYSLSDLADHDSVSRKTAYKRLDRLAEERAAGLKDRRHAANAVANRTPQDVEQLIVELRRQHRTWGAKKLLAFLSKDVDEDRLRCRSTVADILKRNGLVNMRVRRRRAGPPGRPVAEPTTPNEIWVVDFKGLFRTRNGVYCYPSAASDL